MEFRVVLLCGSLAVISSCSVLEPLPAQNTPEAMASWNVREQQIQTIDQWFLTARFSAKSESDAWNGALTWQQQHDDFTINIAGPLNQGSAELTGNKNFARLKVSDKEAWEAKDAESILRKHVGFALPVKELRYWILGIPAPGATSRLEVDADGTVTQFRQDGWTVKFKNYVIVEQVQLPGKVFIEQKEFEFRLVLDQWQLKS